MNNKLRHSISQVVDQSGADRIKSLDALLEAMVHVATDKQDAEHITASERRTAYRAVNYLIEVKLEANIGKAWHATKLERLLS